MEEITQARSATYKDHHSLTQLLGQPLFGNPFITKDHPVAILDVKGLTNSSDERRTLQYLLDGRFRMKEKIIQPWWFSKIFRSAQPDLMVAYVFFVLSAQYDDYPTQLVKMVKEECAERGSRSPLQGQICCMTSPFHLLQVSLSSASSPRATRTQTRQNAAKPRSQASLAPSRVHFSSTRGTRTTPPPRTRRRLTSSVSSTPPSFRATPPAGLLQDPHLIPAQREGCILVSHQRVARRSSAV